MSDKNFQVKNGVTITGSPTNTNLTSDGAGALAINGTVLTGVPQFSTTTTFEIYSPRTYYYGMLGLFIFNTSSYPSPDINAMPIGTTFTVSVNGTSGVYIKTGAASITGMDYSFPATLVSGDVYYVNAMPAIATYSYSISQAGKYLTNDGTTASWASSLPALVGPITITFSDYVESSYTYWYGQGDLTLDGVSPSVINLLANGANFTYTNNQPQEGFTTVFTKTGNAYAGEGTKVPVSYVSGNQSFSYQGSTLVITGTGSASGKFLTNNGTVASWGIIEPAPAATTSSLGTVYGQTDSSNTALGEGAFAYKTTNYGSNTAIGRDALHLLSNGGSNTAIGNNAMRDYNNGDNNIAIGYDALKGGNNSSGDFNIGIGYEALLNVTSGANNVCVGGLGAGKALTTGSNNTFLGHSAGDALTTGSNNITIGYQADSSANNSSNQITLGNSSISTFRCQVTSITSLSDARDKTNIEPLSLGVNFINSLNPVKFEWDMRQPEEPQLDENNNPIIEGKVGLPDLGFIAQDLITAEDATGMADYLQLTLRDNPDRLEATQGRLIPILVKAIQELSAEIELLKEKVN